MKFSIDQNAVILALSRALEFTVSGIGEHHSRVAVIAQKLAEELSLGEHDKTVLLYACLLHDAGVSTFGQMANLAEFDVAEGSEHAEVGCRLLMSYSPLEEVAHVVRFHHDKWEGGNKSGLRKEGVPLLSSIVFLADRIDVSFEKDVYVLDQKKRVSEHVNNCRGTYFRPDLVDCFNKLALAESFWLDLAPANVHDFLDRVISEQDKVVVGIETLMELGEMFATIIDNKSKFTQRHSRGVSSVATKSARMFGFSETEVLIMSLAGLLHDVGKLSIPDEILEKPGKLTEQEFDIIKQHTFYTFNILSNIEGVDEMIKWAAYHHERLDGGGYPFRIPGSDLSVGARIMAVSDVFTALSEDRPYRKRLEKDKVLKILDKQAEGGAIDGRIVNIVKENYDSVNEFFEQTKDGS